MCHLFILVFENVGNHKIWQRTPNKSQSQESVVSRGVEWENGSTPLLLILTHTWLDRKQIRCVLAMQCSPHGAPLVHCTQGPGQSVMLPCHFHIQQTRLWVLRTRFTSNTFNFPRAGNYLAWKYIFHNMNHTYWLCFLFWSVAYSKKAYFLF